MTARDKFNGIKADFWDCEGAEVLTFVDPISALGGIVENHLDGRPTEDVLAEMGTITVSAYYRKVITEEMVRALAEAALVAITEYVDEVFELGDREGKHPVFPLDVLAQHREEFAGVVRDLCGRAKIWRCDVLRAVELTPDEALEILRVERPEWFQAPAPAAASGGAA